MATVLLALAILGVPGAMKIPGSIARPPTVGPGKIPTYPCQLDDLMGWSYGKLNSSPINYQTGSVVFQKNVTYINSGTDEGAKERNFVQQGDFALYPAYHIPSKTEQSFMFNIKFHISGRSLVLNLKPSFTCINVCIYVSGYIPILYYLLGRSRSASRRWRCTTSLQFWQRSPANIPWKSWQHPT